MNSRHSLSYSSWYYYRREVFEPLALFFIALAVKGWFLGETDIGGDECFSLYYSQLPIHKIITILSKGDNPPLHEIILHFWTRLFGISEISIRIPSLLFNCLTVIPIYFIGERYIKRGVGIIAALLFTFSSFSLFMAHEARVYDLVVLLTSLSFLVFLNLINKRNQLLLWLALVIINTALIYAHYLAAWVIVVQCAAIAVNKNLRSSLLLRYIVHLLLVTLLFLPFLPVVFHRFLESGLHGTWITKVTGLEDFYNMLGAFSNKPVPAVVFIFLLLAALLTLALRKELNKLTRPGATVVLLWAWLPLTVSFLLSFKIGFFHTRYLFFTSSAYYLCIAACTVYLSSFINVKATCIMAAMVIVLMCSTFSLHTKGMKYAGSKANIKATMSEVMALKNDSTLILVCPDWFDKEMVYYHYPTLFSSYFLEADSSDVFKKPLEKEGIFPIKNAAAIHIPAACRRVVFVDNVSNFHYPGNGIMEYLAKNFQLNEELYPDRNITLHVFTRKEIPNGHFM